ncbi:MAG: hypothetical protein AAF211_34135, partial [Myxococcota bacterium]
RGDPTYRRTGELLDTPKGFLLRYARATPDDTVPDAVSPDRASVFLPLDALSRPLGREEVRQRLDG